MAPALPQPKSSILDTKIIEAIQGWVATIHATKARNKTQVIPCSYNDMSSHSIKTAMRFSMNRNMFWKMIELNKPFHENLEWHYIQTKNSPKGTFRPTVQKVSKYYMLPF
jgi:hypothetical protein